MLELPRQRYSNAFKNFLVKYKSKIAEISGWCSQLNYREKHPADEYFEISDHGNIIEMTECLKQNEINKVWIINNLSNLPLKYLREHDIQCGILSTIKL